MQFNLKRLALSVTFFSLAFAAFMTFKNLLRGELQIESVRLRFPLIVATSLLGGIFTGLGFGVLEPGPYLGVVIGGMVGLALGIGIFLSVGY